MSFCWSLRVKRPHVTPHLYSGSFAVWNLVSFPKCEREIFAECILPSPFLLKTLSFMHLLWLFRFLVCPHARQAPDENQGKSKQKSMSCSSAAPHFRLLDPVESSFRSYFHALIWSFCVLYRVNLPAQASYNPIIAAQLLYFPSFSFCLMRSESRLRRRCVTRIRC